MDTLVTDDYRTQNLAQNARINWENVNTVGITKIWKWEVICTACKKIHAQPKKTKSKKNLLDNMSRLWFKTKLKKIE